MIGKDPGPFHRVALPFSAQGSQEYRRNMENHLWHILGAGAHPFTHWLEHSYMPERLGDSAVGPEKGNRF